MYFLLETCQHPTVLRTLYFGIIIKDIIFTIIPIGIVLMTIIDFSKAVVAGKEDEQNKVVKLIPKRIMYAIIVFTIPWIVTILMKTLSNLKLSVAMDFDTCLKNAREAEGNFEYYDNLLAEEEKLNDTTHNNGDSGDNDINVSNSTVNRYMNFVKAQINKTYEDYNFPKGQHWCSYFVHRTLTEIKFDNGTSIWDYLGSKGSIGNGARASLMWPAFKAINGWHKSKAYGGNYTPKAGDIIWFQWDYKANSSRCRTKYINEWKKTGGLWDGNTQCSDHIGIVEYVEGNKVHTIEGNINGDNGPTTTKVARATYNIESNNIVVYGSWY